MLKQRLKILVLRSQIRAFHIFGLLCCILGTLITVRSGLRFEILLLMSTTGTFLLSAFAVKRIIGQEIVVYCHHETEVLILCALLVYLFGFPVPSNLGIDVFSMFVCSGCYSVSSCCARSNKHGVKCAQHDYPLFLKDKRIIDRRSAKTMEEIVSE